MPQDPKSLNSKLSPINQETNMATNTWLFYYGMSYVMMNILFSEGRGI
jgi:hypothetical protein